MRLPARRPYGHDSALGRWVPRRSHGLPGGSPQNGQPAAGGRVGTHVALSPRCQEGGAGNPPEDSRWRVAGAKYSDLCTQLGRNRQEAQKWTTWERSTS